jgi:RND family efflux transporter MFP subunit
VVLNSGAVTADYAEQAAARQEKLYAQQNTSLKNLQDAEAQLASLRVIAPLSGTVTRLNVKLGESVDVNMTVAEVIDLNRLAVSAAIPAAEANDLKIGEEVQISGTGFQPVDGQDARSTTATLAFVSPAVDMNSGTVLTRTLLAADSGLRPGQFVQLRIVTAVHTNCLAAPSESIVTDESGHSVIALVKGDEAAQTPVQTDLRENGWVEISGTGLKPGDSVVTIGAYGLPEKTKIQVVNPNVKQ